MLLLSRFKWQTRVVLAFVCSLLLVLSASGFALASVRLVQISSDPYTNSTSQHHTQVEPDIYSFGSTIVAAFQTGRFYDGGGSNIGWATSSDKGNSWTHGFLPGTTIFATPPGIYTRDSDPVVAYDAAHSTWLISSLAVNSTAIGAAVLVNQSTDGGHTWGNAVTVSTISSGQFYDKDWITCDNTATSPFYGHCYVEWDNAASFGQGQILMSTSTDGGTTWGPPQSPANQKFFGIGGQPLVQPNGTVIVPITDASDGTLVSFMSTDGGNSWSTPVTIATINLFLENASIRDGGGLASAQMDGSGTVYLVWQDCRFEANCGTTNYGSADDLVMSTSSDGVTWSAVQRIPIDPIGSGVNHIIPGLGVDRKTSGSHAHLALTYYYFPNAACFTYNCQLDVGFVSSTNGGASWSAAQKLVGPMNLTWLADTTSGFMVGDYVGTAIVGDDAFPVFAVATPPSGGFLNEAMFTVADQDLQVVGGSITSSSHAATVSRSQSKGLSLRTAF